MFDWKFDNYYHNEETNTHHCSYVSEIDPKKEKSCLDRLKQTRVMMVSLLEPIQIDPINVNTLRALTGGDPVHVNTGATETETAL